MLLAFDHPGHANDAVLLLSSVLGAHSNALYAASLEGHDRIVELLLGKDADVKRSTT